MPSSSLGPCRLQPPETINSSGCLSVGSNPEISNEIFNKIFTENYSPMMVREEFSSNPELRVTVMKIIISSFHCHIHHDIIKRRIGFAVWMIGEYSLSFSEIEDGLSVIKRSIGELPFPNSPSNDHYWFEECRQRLLIEGDAKIRTQIAIAVTKLVDKLQVFVNDATKLALERTEAVRLMASMWLLPKPLDLGPSTIEFYSGEISRCMMFICHRDKELKRVFKEASVGNLVSLLSKKLRDDVQRELCDHAVYHLEAILLGSKSPQFIPE